ncbi:hypothetical protein GCM10009429_38950 [Dyella marensis]
MTYQIIQPPFSLQFWDMPKEELKEYFAWFKAVIPERIEKLTEYIRQDPAYVNWKPDNSTSSLDALGEWLIGHLSLRKRTEAEMEAMRSDSPHSIEMPNYDLTDASYSLAFDAGVYFAQMLMAHHPSLSWTQEFKSRKSMDYGQPLLVPFGPVPLNPIGVSVSIAHGLADRSRPASRLREVYEEWSRRAP